MKQLLLISLLLLTIKTNAQQPAKLVADSLGGTWLIDLRPTPDSDPYLKEFKVSKIKGENFDGEFYGTPFTDGFLNIEWGIIYFGFTTQDQTSTYYHSGSIEGNKIHGITLNEGRKFVLPWRGEKKK